MLKQIGLCITIALSCAALPPLTSACPVVSASAVGVLHDGTRRHSSGHAPSRQYHRVYSGHFPHYSPHAIAPYDYSPGYYRPQTKHQAYFDLHGYSSPTWRYPRLLYPHRPAPDASVADTR